MTLTYLPLPTAVVAGWRAGAADANGQPPQRAGAPSTGSGTPCRHCLARVPAGADYLILAHGPFAGLNPYTECGPIFICADDCPAAGGTDLPIGMLQAPSYILRGYSADERIVYGTGGVVPTDLIAARAQALLARPEVAFVHVRSASNTCYFFRIERAG